MKDEEKILKDNMNKKDKLFDIFSEKYHKQEKKLREEKEELKVENTWLKKKYQKLDEKHEAYKKDLKSDVCDEFDKLAVSKEWKECENKYKVVHLHHLKGRVINLIKGDVT